MGSARTGSTRPARQQCGRCYGTGAAPVRRTVDATINGRRIVGTATMDESCRFCGGNGWIAYEVVSLAGPDEGPGEDPPES